MSPISMSSLKKVKSLYYERGLSMREVAKSLGVSIDSVYHFMQRNSLPRRTYKEESKRRFDNKELSFRINKKLNKKQMRLKDAGVIVYWCEGGKASSIKGVDFANSDISMILLFMRFLREICGVKEQRLRIYLYCYSNQNVQRIKEFWSNLTKVPLDQFIKPYIRSDFDIRKSGKMSQGMVHIRYSDKKLLEQIKRWIEEYKAEHAPVV